MLRRGISETARLIYGGRLQNIEIADEKYQKTCNALGYKLRAALAIEQYLFNFKFSH